MIIVTNRIPVAPGQETAFEMRFRRRARLIEKAPGFVKFQIMRPVRSEPGPHGQGSTTPHYLVQACWEGIEQFRAWTKSDSFKEAHAEPPPPEMFAGPSLIEIHEVIQ